MLFLAVLIFQSYLKSEYYQYLLDTTTQTETAVLEVSARNLNGTLQDMLRSSAEIAADGTLHDMVSDMLTADHISADSRLELSAMLNNITHFNGNIAATAILTEDGILMEYGRYWGDNEYKWLWQEREAVVMEQLYESVMERVAQGAYVIYEARPESFRHPAYPEMQLFHLALPLVGNQVHIRNAQAVVVLTIRLDTIVNSVHTQGRQWSQVEERITDRDGTVVFQGSGNGDLDPDGAPQRISTALNYFQWTYSLDIDTQPLRQHVNRMYDRGIAVYGGLLLLCAAVWQLVIRRILKPVSAIRAAMERIGDGELDSRIEVSGEHELWQLAEQYNRMVDALERQRQETQREFQEKTLSLQRQSEAEREALESQINAHFLCNTLGAINYNAIENGNTVVADLLKKLSNILYYTFSKKMKAVTLGEEFSWVEQYLCLQKFRLMDVFDYDICFQEAYSEWPCCKLFLQPFVENSILHGFEGWERGGFIQIDGRAEADRFRIQVRDNGCGMTEEVSQTIHAMLSEEHNLALEDSGQVGIGIQNAVTRLRMYYGSGLSVRMETAPGRGTCFTFWLPLPPEAKNDALEEEEM